MTGRVTLGMSHDGGRCSRDIGAARFGDWRHSRAQSFSSSWPRVREHRLLGGRGAGRRLVIAIRRRCQQQLHPHRRRRGTEAAVEPVGQGQFVRVGSAGGQRLPRGQRPNCGWLLTHGLGVRQQRQATLVHPTGARRRVRRPAVRQVRQRLRRPARHHAVVPPDAVGALAPPGHRDAADPALSRRRTVAGGHPSRSGSGGRQPSRRDDRIGGGPGAGHQPHRQRTRSHRLPAGRPPLSNRGRAGPFAIDRADRHRRLAAERAGGHADRAEVSRRRQPA